MKMWSNEAQIWHPGPHMCLVEWRRWASSTPFALVHPTARCAQGRGFSQCLFSEFYQCIFLGVMSCEVAHRKVGRAAGGLVGAASRGRNGLF
jgi:hypothetical protein